MPADDLRSKLSAAQQEALRVGDSPLRADALADRLPALARDLAASDATDETKARVGAELAAAARRPSSTTTDRPVGFLHLLDICDRSTVQMEQTAWPRARSRTARALSG